MALGRVRVVPELNICFHFSSVFRYDSETNELISDEIGVAYPIVNGIPNLIPKDGRILQDKKGSQQTKDK